MVEEDNPAKEGFQCASWDCVELAAWLAQRGVEVSGECVRQILRRNGFHYVKTKYNFLRKDDNERRVFAKGFFDEAPLLGLENIFFADEAAHKLHPKQGGKWTREEQALVDTNCSHARVTTLGAVCPATGQLVAVQADRNDVEAFISFLKELLAKTSGLVHVILDNYMVHKSKAVRTFLLQSDRIMLHFLPKYPPDMNPVEWLWAWVRKKRTNNKLYQTKEELKAALNQIFATISPETVMRVCNYAVLKRGIT